MRKFLLLCGVVSGPMLFAQNPATTFTIPNRNIVLPCGVNCTSISAQIPHIKQTDDYVITRPAYVPFAYTTPTGNELTSIYTDDKFSDLINLPFPICFYGGTYNSAVIGSNAVITFDASTAGQANAWPLTTSGGSGTPVPIPYAGGTQNSASSTYYPKASIMGPYHDIYPTNTANGMRKIEWRIEGVAPKRRFIASYNIVPMFNCTSTNATHQMVVYESTGIVEVYVKDKPMCTTWNQGLAILGIQNFDRTKAVAAAGKNCTVWGGSNIDSCYRFTPSGGVSRFKGAQLLVNGNVVANVADTSTASAGLLNLNFPNVCPTADSTAYVIRATFGWCNDPAQDVTFTDTVFVKKNAPTLAVVTADANCQGNGSVTMNVTGAAGAVQYSLNGGNTYQVSNVFGNVAPGTYNGQIRVGDCIVNRQVVVGLVNNLTINAGADTTICRGASFNRNIIGTAASYTWSPAAGVSGPAATGFTLSPQNTTTYVVTGMLGNCTATDNVTVNVVAGAIANAGPDAIIIAGDVYLMRGTGTPGSYLWTPPTALSSATILAPNASPQTTTTYTLNVTTPQGCTASDQVTITVVPYCIKPMDAFTPNGDGVNDLWLITNGNCLQKATAQVFNRYGAKVFESNDYKNTWDGTYKGKGLPDGTYYYVISYKLVNGRTEFLKGNVTILR
jgi:gliding motility-associated-like protein